MTITNGYATLAELKARIPIATADTADDTALENVITAVSRWIDQFCNQRFYSETPIVRYYTAMYADLLAVDTIQSVSALATDDNGARAWSTAWAATDYDLEPINNPLLSPVAPYLWIATTPVGTKSFPVGIPRGVKVTGTWGWAAVPAAIKEACLLQSQRVWGRKNAPFGVAGSSATGQTFLLPVLDPDVKLLLSPYRRCL